MSDSAEYYKLCDAFEKLDADHAALMREACRLRLIEKIARDMVITRNGDTCTVDAYTAGRLTEILKLTDIQEDE